MTTLATPQLEQYISQQIHKGETVVFDEFIFANIPNLTANNLQNHLSIPSTRNIVHRQVISQTGVVNQNAVVYSVTIGSDIGDFDFNFIGLINKSKGLLGIAIYTDTVKKLKNKNGIQGNSLTRSVLLEFSNAPQHTNITIPAETWQIDFTLRLKGLDEKIRLTNRDLYGRATFFDDGFLLKRKSGNNFAITAGNAYVEGVRANIQADENISLTPPCSVYVDVVHHCTVTGAYQTDIKFLKTAKNDYIDAAGNQHYVQVLADVARNGTITDRRLLSPLLGLTPKDLDDTTTSTADETGHSHLLPIASLVKKGIVKLFSGTNSTAEDMAATPKAIKALKDLIDSLTRNLGNYIQNSKKSNAINSASSDTVATSFAVKTVADSVTALRVKCTPVASGSRAITLDATKRADWLRELNVSGTGYYQCTFHNLAPSQLSNFPLPMGTAFTAELHYQGAYSKIILHYRNGREFFANVNFNVETLQLNWKEVALLDNVIKKAGNQSITGLLKAERVGSAWAAYQMASEQGTWQLEVHPQSHTANNRRFNMKWMLNGGSPVYLSFPHIADNGDTVAYRRWVNDGYVRKSGDTMTGDLTIRSSDYSKLKLYNQSGKELRFESVPDSFNYFGKISYRSNGEVEHYAQYFPKKSGTLLLDVDTDINAKANKVVMRDGSGDVRGRLFRATYSDEDTMSGAIAFRINNSGNNYTRYCNNPAAIRTWLGFNASAVNAIKAAVSRSSKSRSNTFPYETSRSYTTTGSVIIYPDGRIVQIFHLKNIKPGWFGLEEVAQVGEVYRNIHIPLWTAMPNKIVNVDSKTIRATNNATTYHGEAGEWVSAWQIYRNETNKASVNINISRFRGGKDEDIDLYVVVEGY